MRPVLKLLFSWLENIIFPGRSLIDKVKLNCYNINEDLDRDVLFLVLFLDMQKKYERKDKNRLVKVIAVTYL